MSSVVRPCSHQTVHSLSRRGASALGSEGTRRPKIASSSLLMASLPSFSSTNLRAAVQPFGELKSKPVKRDKFALWGQSGLITEEVAIQFIAILAECGGNFLRSANASNGC